MALAFLVVFEVLALAYGRRRDTLAEIASRQAAVLLAAERAEQQRAIEQVQAQTRTIRSLAISLAIVGSRAPNVMLAERSPLLPRRTLALVKSDASLVQFQGEGDLIDSGDGASRELRLNYRLPDEAALIGSQLEVLADYRALAIDVSDLIAVVNLRGDHPLTIRWTLRANNVAVAAGEQRFTTPEALARGEVRLDVHQELARVGGVRAH